MSDVLADLNAFPNKSMTDGWVHAGFKGELDKLNKNLGNLNNIYGNMLSAMGGKG